MITATPFLAAAADAKLEDWGPLEEATGEPMHTSGTTLWSGEGTQEAGVWECTPGPSRWSLADNEFVHILSGRMTVTPDGGEPTEIGPGDTAVFPRGWAGDLADPRDDPQALRFVLTQVGTLGDMEYRTLGRSGCAVSSLCLGTMTFGVETDEPGAHAELDRFIEAGGNLVDTADVYGDGRSEEIIGRWFASRPADVTEPVVLATKGRFARGHDDSPNGAGLSARHLTRALDASLQRLGLESVDLYQVHAYDPLTPLEETLRTLEGFIRAGKIRYYGLSNFTGWQLTKAVHLARALNVAEPVTLQPQYSLLAREIEWEIVPAVLDAGMGMLPWSPLGGGWLSGKYRRDQRPAGATRLGDDPNRGMEAYNRRGTERTWNVIDAVQKVAEDRGVSMAEVALAWVTARPGVASTILGARTLSQLETNLRAADLQLTAAETAALDAASDPHITDYPYGELGVEQRARRL